MKRGAYALDRAVAIEEATVMCGLSSVVPPTRGTTSGTTPSSPGTSRGPCGPLRTPSPVFSLVVNLF